MNRPLRFAPDGSLVLRPERVYRLLLTVNGETCAEDLEDALVTAGFDRAGLCTSTPRDWPHERPVDWPEEPSVDTAANECLVRLSGRFGGPPYAFVRDTPIVDSTASYTVVSGWDYAPSLTEAAAPTVTRTGGVPRAAPSDHRGTAMFITAAALLGLGVWTSMRGERRMEREAARMRTAIERDEREAIRARVAELVREGKSHEEAAAIARLEMSPDGEQSFEEAL